MRVILLVSSFLITAIGAALLGYSNATYNLTGSMNDIRYMAMAGPLLFLLAGLIVTLPSNILRKHDTKLFLILLGPIMLSGYAISNSVFSV
jgi:hypothetical protein